MSKQVKKKNQPHSGHQLQHGEIRARDFGRRSQFYKEVFKSIQKDKESFPLTSILHCTKFSSKRNPTTQTCTPRTPLQLQITQLQGAILAGRRASRNPTTFMGKVSFGDPPCKSQSSKEWGTLKKKNLSLLIHPREIQSNSSITALHTAQTSIIVFAQIHSQINEVIKKKNKKLFTYAK